MIIWEYYQTLGSVVNSMILSGIKEQRMAINVLGVHFNIMSCPKDLYHLIKPLLGGVRQWSVA